jgi:hypothetical protein
LESSLNIITFIKSRKMGSSGHVAHTGAKTNAHSISVGKPKGKGPLEDLDVG